MYTTKSIRINAKIQNALEMIQKCNNTIEKYRSDLYHYDNSDQWSIQKIMHKREDFEAAMVRYKQVKARLITYYEDLLYKLIMEAFKNNITLSNYTKDELC